MRQVGVRQFHLDIYSKTGVVAKTLNEYVKKQKRLLAVSGDLDFKQSEIMLSECSDRLPEFFINCDEDVERVQALEEETRRLEEIRKAQEREAQLKRQEEERRLA